MLADHLTVGMKLYGLRRFLMQSVNPTSGGYRVVSAQGMRYIQFAADRIDGRSDIIMLPYRPGEIKSVPMNGEEVISGEFTGCIMAMYNEAGTLKCGHVCTASGYSQRATFTGRVDDHTYTNVVQLDTRGMVANYVGATLNTSVLCVANPGTSEIRHVYVEREREAAFTRGQSVTEDVYRVVTVG